MICWVFSSTDMKFLLDEIWMVSVYLRTPRLARAFAMFSVVMMGDTFSSKLILYFGNVNGSSFHTDNDVPPGFIQVVVPEVIVICVRM